MLCRTLGAGLLLPLGGLEPDLASRDWVRPATARQTLRPEGGRKVRARSSLVVSVMSSSQLVASARLSARMFLVTLSLVNTILQVGQHVTSRWWRQYSQMA